MVSKPALTRKTAPTAAAPPPPAPRLRGVRQPGAGRGGEDGREARAHGKDRADGGRPPPHGREVQRDEHRQRGEQERREPYKPEAGEERRLPDGPERPEEGPAARGRGGARGGWPEREVGARRAR